MLLLRALVRGRGLLEDAALLSSCHEHIILPVSSKKMCMGNEIAVTTKPSVTSMSADARKKGPFDACPATVCSVHLAREQIGLVSGQIVEARWLLVALLGWYHTLG